MGFFHRQEVGGVTPELYAIFGSAAGIAVLLLGAFSWLRRDIAAVETRLHAELTGLKADNHVGLVSLKADIQEAEKRVTSRIERLEERFDSIFEHWLKPPTGAPTSEPAVMPAERR